MTADALFTDWQHQIIALAKRYAVPTMFEFRHFVVAGGLISYGADPNEAYRQTGNLVGRVLKGEKPADLPVHAAEQVRAGYQHKDREGPRYRGAELDAVARRRGDRMSAAGCVA
jgi:ABC-type uncharacterized transport system substrate-binding protein